MSQKLTFSIFCPQINFLDMNKARRDMQKTIDTNDIDSVTDWNVLSNKSGDNDEYGMAIRGFDLVKLLDVKKVSEYKLINFRNALISFYMIFYSRSIHYFQFSKSGMTKVFKRNLMIYLSSQVSITSFHWIATD